MKARGAEFPEPPKDVGDATMRMGATEVDHPRHDRVGGSPVLDEHAAIAEAVGNQVEGGSGVVDDGASIDVWRDCRSQLLQRCIFASRDRILVGPIHELPRRRSTQTGIGLWLPISGQAARSFDESWRHLPLDDAGSFEDSSPIAS